MTLNLPHDNVSPYQFGYKNFSGSEDIFWTKLDTWTDRRPWWFQYWVVQAGLLTPLHHLSPLAVFTSGAYFLIKEGRDNKFVTFTVPTLTNLA